MSRKFFYNLHFGKSGMKFPASFGSTIGDLWEISGLSVAVSFHLSLFGVLLYIIVMPYFRHFNSFVPKIGGFGG